MSNMQILWAASSLAKIIQDSHGGKSLIPYELAEHQKGWLVGKNAISKRHVRQHLLWMCGEIPKFIETGHVAKAMRWVCFVQGVIWMAGIVSINALKDQNR